MYSSRSYTTKKPGVDALEIPNAPADTISCIAFSPDNSIVAVGAWDGTVNIYRHTPPTGFGTSQPLTHEKVFTAHAPVLSAAFFGQHIVAGCVDGSLVCFDFNGTQTVIPAHSAGVKGLANFENQILVSGSFDNTLKFWDLKSMQPAHAITLPAKVYSLSLIGPVLSVALSNRTVCVYDMKNLSIPKNVNTKFNYSIRSVDFSPDMDTLVVSSVDARIEIISKSTEAKRFMVRAHRNTSNCCYSVNIVKFCPLNADIIVSGGSDGNLVWFDKANRLKLTTNSFDAPITAGQFSSDGRSFVFATGDDWSKGFAGTYVKPVLRYIESKNVPSLTK